MVIACTIDEDQRAEGHRLPDSPFESVCDRFTDQEAIALCCEFAACLRVDFDFWIYIEITVGNCECCEGGAGLLIVAAEPGGVAMGSQTTHCGHAFLKRQG
ncbi:hypothetical protein EBB59_07040 [Lysobacter pythonis]|uniref:Uncharacterized protein n=1 Tax=Solilutibacter pythonis TaxID=2483112 RepID=A0A3M2I444_9GAMM|nr:hypothetical protein EBB59_07040 [Lysobacter pythonis]